MKDFFRRHPKMDKSGQRNQIQEPRKNPSDMQNGQASESPEGARSAIESSGQPADMVVTTVLFSSRPEQAPLEQELKQTPAERPSKLESAQRELDKAAAKLREVIPADVLQREVLDIGSIQDSADVSYIAENLGSFIESMMHEQNIKESGKSAIPTLIKGWVKKTLPFIHTGLTTAKDAIPVPFGWIVFGVIFIVQQIEKQTELAEKIDNTFNNLSRAISTIVIGDDFPRSLSPEHVDQIRSAAIVLTASVMHCLYIIIKYLKQKPIKNAIKDVFAPPDIDNGVKRVCEGANYYSTVLTNIATAMHFQKEREKEEKEILEWICPKDRGYIMPKRRDDVADTCQMFLNSKEYLRWVGQGPSTFICAGQPGAGKSHLVSVIFHRLRENPRVGLAYFFFNHSNREQMAENVIRCLLKQVIAQLPIVPADVISAFSKFNNDPHKLLSSTDEVSILLKSSLDKFFQFHSSPCFILLDAYDEFRNDADEDSERAKLCSYLSEISSTNNAKIFITTRLHCRMELESSFPDAQVAELKGDLKDMRQYLDRKLQFLRLNGVTKNLIKTTILEANKEKPWFLLVILQVNYVLESKDPVKIKARFKTLPKTPIEAYRGIIDRMTPGEQDLARRILGWILLARRVLKMSELREALALQVDGPSLDKDDMPDEELVVRTCGGLLDHHRDDDLVTFSHETVRPFLEEHELEFLPSHTDLSKACLAYLALPEFEKPCQIWKEFQERRSKFQFIDYSAKFWAAHAVQSDRNVELEQVIIKIFGSYGRTDAMEQTRKRGENYTKGKSLLHVLIENDLAFIFTSLSGDESIQHRHDSFSISLIKSHAIGVWINALDGDDETPLHYATKAGDLQTCKWLVQNKAAVNVNGKNGTALHIAACNGYLNVVKWLLEEGHADVNVKANNGKTALHYATICGHLEIVKWLIEEGHADVNAKGNYGETALHYAALRGYLGIVEWMVEEGHADISAKENNQWTALHYASSNSHLEVIKWIIEQGHADANAKRIALHFAVNDRELEIIKWLVQEGHADINIKGKGGRTTLHYAAIKGYLEIVKWMVEEGHADVKAEGNNGWTILHYAARNGRLGIVKYLIEEGHADINVKGNRGNTALHLATIGGHMEIIQWLVEVRKVDVGERNNRGRTASELARLSRISQYLSDRESSTV